MSLSIAISSSLQGHVVSGTITSFQFHAELEVPPNQHQTVQHPPR